MNTIEQQHATLEGRKERLLSGGEVTLAIERKHTNLRIWIGNELSIAEGGGRKLIYMRLDCFKAYSAALSEKSIGYLVKPHTVIEKIGTEFGFTSDASRIDELLELTKDMKYRQVEHW